MHHLRVRPTYRSCDIRSVAASLAMHGSIKTRLNLARALRRWIERLVTKCKSKDLAAFRKVLSLFNGSKELARKFFELAAKYNDRPGGYTRVVKCGFRSGDDAPMAVIQFV